MDHSYQSPSVMKACFIKKSEHFLITHYPSYNNAFGLTIISPENTRKGYVLFDQTKLGDNIKEEKRVCAKCGGIKSYDDFYQQEWNQDMHVLTFLQGKRFLMEAKCYETPPVYFSKNKDWVAPLASLSISWVLGGKLW